jgi:LysR family cyn operon transcriptional activator
MEIRQLRYFVKAAETLHFTDSATALFVTQSTLSQQIKQLEEELGILLFERIGKRVRLTEAGYIFLHHARQILSGVEKGKQAIADLNEVLTGDLKIGVTFALTSLLIATLNPFSLHYPGIRIFVEYGTSEDLEKKLRLSELDIVLAFHENENDQDLVMQLLFTAQMVLVVSKKNALAQLKKVQLRELDQMALILPGKGFSTRNFLDDIFRRYHIHPSIKMELNDIHSLLQLVDTGNWATILTEKSLIGWKNLAAITINGKAMLRKSFIMWTKNAYQKKAATLFVLELQKIIAEMPPVNASGEE